jgi:hypothetical protein
MEFIKPNIVYSPSLSVGQDDGFAHKVGLGLVEFSEDGACSRFGDWHDVARIGCREWGVAHERAVATALAQSRDRYSKSIGEARLMVGNAIRMMCRSPKYRAGCHFGAAIGLRSLLEDCAPEIPDWANDQHTLAEKKLGRGLDHFRKDGAKLVPPSTADDPDEDEAYRLWAIKQRSK